MITYREAEQYISDIPKFAGKHTLKDTERLLVMLTEGKINSKIIHVAGTNGKGSVCAYLRSILMESGASVGMFISPHLETTRERICIGNEIISEEDFVSAFEQVKETVLEDDKQCAMRGQEPGYNHPSYFEYLFLMAMVYFKKKAQEYIILETGLGGRLDATNCIKDKKVCVITEIGYDHMQYLGDTLEKIAGEKAGIMQRGVPVVFLDKRSEVTNVLEKYAEKVQCPVHLVGKDDISEVNIGNKTIDFSLRTGYYNYVGLSLNVAALYQTENASLAVCAAEILSREDDRIGTESIERGLLMAHWPGRMEEVIPGIYLDGAHNEDGIEAFLNSVEKIPCDGRRLLMFGVVADKQYEKIIKQIAESNLFSEVAVTVLESDRSASLDRLREIWGQYRIYCSFHQSAEEAYHHLLSDRKDADIIYIAGSLYLIGQMKTLMRRIPDD
ncbi:MAG: bifunctional folylpolyglutamate synthase/dihydrofolate synthase [Suilimivivens sp.]